MRKFHLEFYMIPLILIVGVFFIFSFAEKSDHCSIIFWQLNENIEGLTKKNNKSEFGSNGLRSLYERCRFGNSSGSCFELFRTYRKVTDLILTSLDEKCILKDAEYLDSVRSILFEGIRIMLLIAWSSAKENEGAKFGWFTLNDINLFCRMKKASYALDPEFSLEDRFISYLNLKTTEDGCLVEQGEIRKDSFCLTKSLAWDKSLMSYNCAD